MSTDFSKNISAFIALLPNGVLVWDISKQKVVTSNRSIPNELGYKSEMLSNDSWKKLVHPEDLPAIENFESNPNSCPNFCCEARLEKADGDWAWYSFAANPITLPDGQGLHLVITFTPVKQMCKYYQYLAESKNRFAVLADASFGGIGIHDKGVIIEANHELARMTGYEHDSLIGMDGMLLIAPEEREKVIQKISSEFEQRYESVGLRKDGTSYLLEIRGKQIPYKGKSVRVTEFRNIEEQKAFQKATIDSEKRYRDIIEFAVDGFIIGDANGYVVDTNQRLLQIIKKSREEVVGKHISEFFSAKILEEKPLNFQTLIKGETIVSEREIVKPNGEVVCIEMHSKKMPDDTYQAIVRDITERKKVQTEIETSEAKHKAIFSHANDAILIMDSDGFVDCNPKAEKLYGCSKDEIVGKRPEFFSPDFQLDGQRSKDMVSLYTAKALKGESLYFEWIHMRADGTQILTEISLSPLQLQNKAYVQAIVRDITERRKVELALEQERLLMHSMMENVVDQIYFKDLNSLFIRTSRNVISRFNLESDNQIVGKSDFDFFALEHAQMAFDIEQKIIETGKPIAGLIEKEVWPDGHVTWASTTRAPLCDRKGNVIGTFGISRDVTHRRRLEELHSKTERRFRHVVEATNDGIWDWNIKTGDIFFSDRYYTMLGYEPGEFESTFEVWEHLLHPDDAGFANRIINKYAKEHASEFNVEFRLKAKDGSWRWIQLRSKAVEFDSNSHPMRMVGSHMDITERKAMEEKLRESNSFLQSVLDTIPVRVVWKDKHSRFLGCNRSLAHDAGFKDPSDMIGLTDYDMSWHTEAPLYQADDRMVMESRQPKINYEEPQTTLKGDIIWLRTSKIPLLDGNGNVLGVLGTYEDITETKKTNELIELEKAYFEQLFESSPEGIVLLDVNDCVVRCNEEFTRLFGFSQTELVGRPVNSFIVPSDLKDEGQNLTQKVADGNIMMYETQRQRKDGSIVHVSILAKPIYFREGKIAVYGIYRDISDRKMVEEELVHKTHEIEAQNEEYRLVNEELYDAKLKAEESDRLKSAFLANMSHEIRTPMNGILGFSQLLTNPSIDEVDVKEYVDVVQSCGKQLLVIINDLIDIAKIEANQISISESNTNINQLLHEQFLLFRSRAEAKGLEISYSKGLPDERAMILTDSGRVRQIINNLLNNAIKFTHSGSIKFGYTLKDSMLHFIIEDTGVGIIPEHFDSIFERFSQVEMRITEQTGGTGLGLAISKAFITKMGGAIWVESVRSKGSTFHFTLPYKQSIASEQPKPMESKKIPSVSKQVKLLVAEDDDMNFFYIQEMLSPHNFSIIRASNGIEAVELARTIPDFDMVFMDIKMPQMDGYAATAEIKKIRVDLPIIAQTAYAFASDRNKALEAGCDDYISKPIDRIQMLTLISKYLKK